MKAKEKIARAAATEWCRCWKCDGVVRHSGSKCDKAKLLTCHKWYDGYRTALLALGDAHVKVEEEPKIDEPQTCEICTIAATDYLDGHWYCGNCYGVLVERMKREEANMEG